MRKLPLYRHKMPGRLITVCGLDGSGKTTMMRHLISDLEKDYDVLVTKQPTTWVRDSEIFRTYMDSPDHRAFEYRSLSLLAAADRLQHVSKVIQPALEQGKIVISDRYVYSCLANLRARGFKKDRWLYEISQSIIRPDAAFFFDVPVEMAIERVRRRPEEKDRYIDKELQYRLREEYQAICKSNRGILISTEASEEACYRQVKQIVERMIGNGYY